MIKFGTDGWRAVVADEFTFDNVRKVAQAHAEHIKDKGGKRVAVGYDTRFLSEEFAKAVAEVFSSNGFEVLLSKGFCSTPALSLATRDFKCDEGVMITASHNTYQYNGYKIKGSYGGPGTPEIIEDVERRVESVKIETGKREWEEVDFNGHYLNKLKGYLIYETFKQHHYKVVHDPMHGATIGYLHRLMDDTYIEVLEVNNFRDAFFGFHHPEPIEKNLQLLMGKVVATGSILGVANDGDGDRVGIVAEDGEFISTQTIYSLLLLHLIRNRKVPGAVVKTVSTSYLVDRICKKEGRRLYKTPVGFKYIADIMQKEEVAFGGEESGGYGFGFHIPERDGLLSGLMILEMILLKGKSLTDIVKELFEEFGSAYYKRLDLRVSGDEGRQLVKKLRETEIEEFAGRKVVEVDKTDGVKLIFDDNSWILFRASGTEPVLRIYAEAPTTGEVDILIEEGKKLLN